jgi:dipeptidyl aminopeptidase/acylaminoacyl peptidase
MQTSIRRFIRSGAVVVCVGAAASGTISAATRTVTLDDLARVRSVSDVQRSPDGRWVAYVVSTTNVEKDRHDSDVWMVSWDGTQQVRLTFSPESEERPRWSPDGKHLAFLASRGDEDQKKKGDQVWVLNTAGGEAEQLTDVKGGVSDYAWSPDSTHLVLSVSDPNPNDEPEQKEGWKRKTKPPIVIDRYHFKQDKEGYLENVHTHLYLFDVAARTMETLTSGAFDDENPAWSPDGRLVAFVSNRSQDPDRTTDTNVFVIEAKAGAMPRALTTFKGPDHGPLAWRSDSGAIAYLQGDEQQFDQYSQDRLAIVPVTGAPRVVTAALDRTVSSPAWSADGRSVYGLIEDDRTVYLGRISPDSGAVEPLTTGRRVLASFSVGSDGNLAVVGATDTEPDEVSALEQGRLRRLTHQNDAWLQDVRLASTEDVTFTAKDGTVVNGLLAKPPAWHEGIKYPLILKIHGGPSGEDEHLFDFAREYFAANGYLVLEVNYRGSSGRGSAFQHAIAADWGHKEVIDLLAAVDGVVSKGLADPTRLGIGGWSYGGMLTNYTIATDPRFKAAVSGGSTSMPLYGQDQYIIQYDSELGPPWKAPEVWMKISYPFFHADRIRTPTLFIGGEKDFNVPLAGVEQMYQALKSLNVDTQLIIYPGQHHGFTVPSYQRDRLERFIAWYDKYLKPAAKTTME